MNHVISCSKNADCEDKMQCLLGVCYDPCTSGCGESALCSVDNHNILCSCPQGFSGNPDIKCTIDIKNVTDIHSQKPKEYKDIPLNETEETTETQPPTTYHPEYKTTEGIMTVEYWTTE